MPGEGHMVIILLVEDNPDDIIITKKALKEAHILNTLYVARDGQEALDFLRHRGLYQDPATSPKPGLILMDINMPKMSGVEVLTALKQDASLRRIPIVMLTSSKREEDIVKSYDQGCNSFLQKPVDFDQFVELVKQVGLYWGVLNVEPPNGS